MKLIKRCLHKCRTFAKRAAILLLAAFAVTVVATFGGEAVTLPLAIARISEALGAAAADSFVE